MSEHIQNNAAYFGLGPLGGPTRMARVLLLYAYDIGSNPAHVLYI